MLTLKTFGEQALTPVFKALKQCARRALMGGCVAALLVLPSSSQALPDASAFVGKWYRDTGDATLTIKETNGELSITGNFHQFARNVESNKATEVHVDLGRLLFKIGKYQYALLLQNDQLIYQRVYTYTRHEDPAQRAERRAQTAAAIAGVVDQAAQTRTDIARTNAEVQQQIEQQKTATTERLRQEEQQQLQQAAARQQAQEQAQQQQALDQRARDQQATELRLQAQAAANEKAAQQLQQQQSQQQQASAPKQIASNSTSPRTQTPAPPPNQQQPTPQPTPQNQPPVRTQPALSDLAIEDVQLHDPNAIDGNVCFVSYTLFNHFNRTVSITVDVDVVSRGLESQARYVDGIGPNMSYTFKHQEDISCRPADADGRTAGTGHIRAVE
jgi:hypothetical protein